MLLIAFVAIAGGITTGVAMAPSGLVIAGLTAPLGGSLCATAAGLGIMMARGPAHQSDEDLDAQTDDMVASLKGIAAQAKRGEPSQFDGQQDGKRVA